MKTLVIGDFGQKIGGAKKDRYSRTFASARSPVPQALRVKKAMEFCVWRRRACGTYFLAKQGDREHRVLMEFANRDEAMNYRDRFSQEQLEAIWAEVRSATTVTEQSVRHVANRPRFGSDYRHGGSVSPEAFLVKFQPYGVEFGNWQDRRESCLNEAYDALLDLAAVIGWSAPALMFNGKLALAFGARGSGKVAAHYETNHRVINLTKTAGAGCLAHEWFHAFDHYLTTSSDADVVHQLGIASKHFEFTGTDDLRALLRSIPEGMKKRSINADHTRSGGRYWSTPHEICARAFEAWVASKVNNDYLANIVPESEFTKGESRYPYPIEPEMSFVGAAFSRLFKM